MNFFQAGKDEVAPRWASAGALNAFVLTAQTGSVSAAALQLGTTPSAVSKAIRTLEKEIGHTLFWRNTRRLSLSAAGERLLPFCMRALDQLATASREMAAEADTISGRIKVGAPAGLARFLMRGPLTEWLRKHHGLRLDWSIDSRFLLPAEDGVDILLRVAEAPPEEWVAVPLWTTALVTVAAPDYLERFGVPNHPSELYKHRCLLLTGRDGARIPWHFAETGALTPPAAMVADDESVLLSAVEGALGIAQALEFNAQGSLAEGRLREILPSSRATPLGVFALRAAGVSSGKVRAFIDEMLSLSALMPTRHGG